jgi:hypothetical protein
MERGIVRLNPTVATDGEVSRIPTLQKYCEITLSNTPMIISTAHTLGSLKYPSSFSAENVQKTIDPPKTIVYRPTQEKKRTGSRTYFRIKMLYPA